MGQAERHWRPEAAPEPCRPTLRTGPPRPGRTKQWRGPQTLGTARQRPTGPTGRSRPRMGCGAATDAIHELAVHAEERVPGRRRCAGCSRLTRRAQGQTARPVALQVTKLRRPGLGHLGLVPERPLPDGPLWAWQDRAKRRGGTSGPPGAHVPHAPRQAPDGPRAQDSRGALGSRVPPRASRAAFSIDVLMGLASSPRRLTHVRQGRGPDSGVRDSADVGQVGGATARHLFGVARRDALARPRRDRSRRRVPRHRSSRPPVCRQLFGTTSTSSAYEAEPPPATRAVARR